MAFFPPFLQRLDPLRRQIIVLVVVLGFVALVYSPTLQTIINGSSDDIMADVGETQVVLNTWGTLHATGYPLFVILGNLLVSGMKALGISPAAAPTFVSLAWGLATIALVYLLALHLTQRILLAAAAALSFGLTRTVWIHGAIAEVYTFAFLLFVLLLLIALWEPPIRHRVEWLALVGGIGLAHHRLLVLAIPPLLYAVWPQLWAELRARPRTIVVLFLLGLMGLVPYIYLPLRAQAGAAWVYGQPGTLSGLWDQMIARENPTIVTLPGSLSALAAKFSAFNSVLFAEVSLPGLLLGLLGLGLAATGEKNRRAAVTLWLTAGPAYAFAVLLFDDILPPVIVPITLSIIFGWALLFHEALSQPKTRRWAQWGLVPLVLLPGAWMVQGNFGFVSSRTQNPTGLETIELARGAPPGSTLMLDWGTRYFAVGFAQDVLGDLKTISRATGKSDFAVILARGPLATPAFTFFEHPPQWWANRLESPVYLRAAGPNIVQIDTQPKIDPQWTNKPVNFEPSVPVTVRGDSVRCGPESADLYVDWLALAKPPRDLAVFVHALDGKGSIIAQADQSAPVYGWRPLTTWLPGEIVRDVYPLPRLPQVTTLTFGFYEKLASGEFKNYSVFSLPLDCAAETTKTD